MDEVRSGDAGQGDQGQQRVGGGPEALKEQQRSRQQGGVDRSTERRDGPYVEVGKTFRRRRCR